MNLRQYKKLQVKIVNEAKDDEILVVRFDTNKIRPDMTYKFMNSISNIVKCRMIALPTDMNIKCLNVKTLESIKNMIDAEIESR